MAQRTDVVYELLDGHKVVYVGKTNDPKRREIEHRTDGKEFTSMRIITPKLTPESANRREEQRIQTYMSNHSGNTPQYNENTTGK